MRFQTPLISARLVRRYKRFLADCRLGDGQVVTAHVANPGSMLGLCDPGLRVWLERNDDPRKKLRYAWRLAEPEPGVFVGVDTGAANRIVEAAIIDGTAGIAHDGLRREVRYGDGSRVDFLIRRDGAPDLYLEVKSVTLSRTAGRAEFPDSVTARGAKHLSELSAMVAQGHAATLLYLVQRSDCDAVGVAADIDPAYADALARARAAGVGVMALFCDLSPEGARPRGPARTIAPA